MELIERVKERSSKLKALAISGAVGVAAFSGTVLLDDSSEGPADAFNEEDFEKERPKEIDSQIDENKEKLDSLADENNSNTDYSVMGC